MKLSKRILLSLSLIVSVGGGLVGMPFSVGAVTALQDVTAPGLPVDLMVRPVTATTIKTFVISWFNPDDESGIDSVHYTIDVAPTSNSDGETSGIDDENEGSEEFLVLEDMIGAHTIYIWLEDLEGNADFSKTAVLRIFPEGESEKVIRVGAHDRYETAVEISKKVFPDPQTAASVVLVNGERPVDALGAVPLAAQAHGSILFIKQDSIPALVSAEIQRVLPAGSTIYLIGGTAAIDEEQSITLLSYGYNVIRLAGSNRAQTAVAVAGTVKDLRQNRPHVAFIVSADAIADGLSVGPAAERFETEILLTGTTALSKETIDYLTENNVKVVYLIGGTSVIGNEVVAQLNKENIFAFRIAGKTRYETSATIATTFFGDSTRPGVGLANGESVIDSLPAGVHLSAQNFPVLLVRQTFDQTRCLATARYISTYAKEIDGAYAYGGTSVIADETIGLAEQLMIIPEAFSEQPLAGC
jgi:putative cell wall-binding protein